MARKKPAGRLNRGPFDTSEIEAALGLDGWYRDVDGAHRNWRHPTRRGKVQTSSKWTSVRVGSPVWRGILLQSGYTKEQFLALLNGQQLAN